MGQNASELRDDIAHTRAELGRDLDALGDRVSPRRMMERRGNRTRRWFNHARDRVMGTTGELQGSAKERVSSATERASATASAVPERAQEQVRGNPTMAGAVAFGLGFLLAMAITPTDEEREAVERLEPRLEPLKEEVSSSAHEVGESMKETGREVADDLKDSAKEHGEHVRDTAKERGEQVRDTAQQSSGRR